MKTPFRLPWLRRTLFLEQFHRRCGGFSLPVAALASVCLALMPPHGLALPAGGQLVAGQVTTTVNGAQLTLDQASRAAIMNWQSFNIAPNEMVRILQSGADAAMLARVTGGDPSQLLGSLKADGKLFLINPRGILVGQGAIIDTAAFMASTLDVADADFLKDGPLTFKGDSAAGVVNLGTITAREGNVLLLAHTVKNTGEISAAKGTAGLGAGTEVYLASPDAPTFVVKANLTGLPSEALAKEGVDNSGVIAAAQAQLEAAGGSMFDLAVNHSGVIQAAGVEHRPGGRILLTAGGGNVSVTGSATARAADGSGGEILVGGDFQGKNAAVANAARTYVGAAARLEAGDAATTGGKVIVWADAATRFAGAITTGANGFAEVSGKRGLDFAGTVNTRGGSLLLDPDDITIEAGTSATPAGLADRLWTVVEDPGSQTLGADTLAGLLATGSVIMDAANTLTVNASITAPVGSPAGTMLSFNAPTITINQPVSLANVTGGQLQLTSAGPGPLSVSLTSAAGAALSASKILIADFRIVTLNGPVTADNFIYNYITAGTTTSLTATNPANAITHFTLNTDAADPNPVSFSGNVAVHSGTAMNVQALIGAANNVTLSSAGNLTLEAADISTPATAITASGTVKLASTGGVLINQAGAGLLAGPGRRLLYTSDTTGAFSLGGLAGYAQEDGVSFPADPNGGVMQVLYRAAGAPEPEPEPEPVLIPMTIIANDFIKLYGQPDPVFTASYAGGTALDLTTLPSFSILQGAHVNVGAYIIVPAGAASATHAPSYVNGTLRIDPALLTYVANPASRVYGDANPAFSGTVTGFVNGDTLLSATTGALTFTSPAAAADNAGSWAINGGGLTANFGNYVFQDAVANLSALTINQAPLTVTFGNATRTYGDPNPAFSPAAVTGLRNGDTEAVLSGLAAASGATTTSPVGAYPIANTPTAANYAITVVPGTLTVTPAPLTVAFGNVTRAYGDLNPAFSPAAVTGLRSGDTTAVISGLAGVTTATTASPVGTYPIGTAATATNYAITIVPGILTVTPAPLTVRADNASRLYGEPNPALTAAFSGLKNGDSGYDIPGWSLVTSATAGSPVGTYRIDAAGESDRYAIIVIPAMLTVNKAPLTATVSDLNRVYRQEGAPAFGFVSVTGLQNGDTASVISGLEFNTTYGSLSGAGVYPVTASGMADNYVVTFVPGSVTVTPAPLTLVPTAPAIFYGEQPSFGFEAAPGVFLTAGDVFGVNDRGEFVSNLKVTVTAPTFVAPFAPGTYELSVTEVVESIRNFDFAGALPGVLQVQRRPIFVSAGDVDSLVGAIPKDFAFAVTTPGYGSQNLVPMAAPTAGGPQFSFKVTATATQSSGAGTYSIVPELVLAPGTTRADFDRFYALEMHPGRLVVNPSVMDSTGLRQLIMPDATETTVVFGDFKQANNWQNQASDLFNPADTKAPARSQAIVDAFRPGGKISDLLVNGKPRSEDVVSVADWVVANRGDPLWAPYIENALQHINQLREIARRKAAVDYQNQVAQSTRDHQARLKAIEVEAASSVVAFRSAGESLQIETSRYESELKAADNKLKQAEIDFSELRIYHLQANAQQSPEFLEMIGSMLVSLASAKKGS